MLYALQLASQGFLLVGVFLAGFLGGRVSGGERVAPSGEQLEQLQAEQKESCLHERAFFQTAVSTTET